MDGKSPSKLLAGTHQRKKVESKSGGGKVTKLGKHFGVLVEMGLSGDAMEVGHEGNPSLIDQHMVDVGGLHHKWVRNPPMLTNGPV